MIELASEFGKWLRANLPVYLLCTGLYENIIDVCNVKNLTFFSRATTIKTEPLNKVLMSQIYANQPNVDLKMAKELASITKGYAYAFQNLGVMYFSNKDKSSIKKQKLDSLCFRFIVGNQICVFHNKRYG